MKRKWKITAVLLLMLAVAAGQLPQLELHAAPDDEIKMDMKVGFDKFYKLGYITPVYFEIENKLRDINGELQIEMPNQNDSITVYAMEVSLPKDSTKKFVMNIPVNVFNTKINVNLAEGKTIVSKKTFRVDPGSNRETFAIGILSDAFDSVRYINKITIKNLGNIGTKNVRLDEAGFPEDADALKAFNVIVINDYDTSRLGKAQYEALKKWVSEGGVLIIGTGPSGNKTLSAFKDDFIRGETGEVVSLNTSSLHKLAESKTAESMAVSSLDISIDSSTPILREGEHILLQRIEKGRGMVGIASFDFGMAPLSTWTGNSTFADKLMGAVLPQYYLGEVYQKGVMMYENVYAIDNALRNIPELPLPKTSHMIYIYIAYILLAAPISYMILKRLDRRELMWITVPLLSLAFSGAVYVTGAGTRLTEPVTNVISLVDIDNSGTITPKSYAGIFTPQKESIRIEAGAGYDIQPMLMNNGYYGGFSGNNSYQGKVDSKVVIGPRTTLEFYRNGVWSMKTMSIEADETIKGKLESDLNYANGSFSGTIKNTSGFDLEECYIITPSQYASIGPVKNGETKQVEIKPVNYYGQRYDLINAIYKDPYSGSQNRNTKYKPEEIAQIRKNNQKRQVLEYSFMNEAYQGFEARLMAWSSTPVAGELLVNGSVVKGYEKSLITSKVNMSFREGNTVEYPLGFLKPTIINNQNNGNYDEYGRTFYGRGTFEVHYKIDGSIAVESIRTQYTVGNTQRVRQYLWDVREGAWAEGDYRGFDIKGDLLGRYIDGDNTLKIKIEMDEDNVQLPLISVKGSVK
ncbi:MAG TPA: hypothetical protein VN580_01275 [Clostridia bacterium]|nr:hypothetical protein [Clostridia bacterium]